MIQDPATVMTSFTQVLQQIETRLDSLILETDKENKNKETLFEAARYSLLNGGKRIRPILTISTATLLGAPVIHSIDCACAIEMIHTYSLIHDDLPCMDNDDFRRGKLSSHKVYGEAGAILTGDFLLTEAFGVIARDHFLKAEQKIAIISLLSQAAGGDGMVLGQLLDIAAEGNMIDLEMLKTIHRYKTGSLITAAIDIGAIVACASQKEKELLHAFGDFYGLGFQIVDDIIDVTRSKEKHGKEISSDLINNKATYVTLLGMDAAKKAAIKLIQQALEQLEKLPYDTVLLNRLASSLMTF